MARKDHKIYFESLLVSINDEKIFDSCLDFYQFLGFEILKTESQSQIYKRRATLNLYSDTLISSFHSGLSITLELSDTKSYPFKAIFHADIKKLEKTLSNVVFSCENDQIIVNDPAGNSLCFSSLKGMELNDEPQFKAQLDSIEKQLFFSTSPSSAQFNCEKKKIAILTSGGDSSGMNACVRSIVRLAYRRGCIPYAIMEGYSGLIIGTEKYIRPLEWKEVQCILDKGGTIIGTARSKEFRERSGRLLACKNLIKNGISYLIVVGGDGSLTGCYVLRKEWRGLVEELEKKNEITKEEALKYGSYLNIVGLVGSIDNDLASTDITIGAISSLHRICEAVDSISSTATSHQRAFVVEVMGRNCGWLALTAAIANAADYLFLPECPPEENWEAKMCEVIQKHRLMGKRKSIIIIAEGAIDRNLKPILASYVQNLISTQLGVDSRVTTLGHVQRGGTPAAFDRFLGTIQGTKALDVILSQNPEDEPKIIGMSENLVTVLPLMETVELTLSIGEKIRRKEFHEAFSLRDYGFRVGYETYNKTVNQLSPKPKNLTIGIIHCGAPSGGMNAATKTVVRYALNLGYTVLGIHNGFSGLVQGEVSKLNWMDVESWTVEGGSNLGTNRTEPSDNLGFVAFQLQKYEIKALVVIGGFEGFNSIKQMREARKTYPSFCIPLCLIPATVSNNVPGTFYTLGSDTALNVILEACDRIRQSALSSRKRVFVVEVQGGKCGYLATMAGLMCGITAAYIPEEGISLDLLSKDCRHLIRKFSQEKNHGKIIIRNEWASSTYTTDVISSIYESEGKNLFDCRASVLGHIQQGGTPSPMDRVLGCKLAVASLGWIEQQFEKMYPDSGFKADFLDTIERCPSGDESAVVIGFSGTATKITSVKDLIPEVDFVERKWKKCWWLELNRLIRVLSDTVNE